MENVLREEGEGGGNGDPKEITEMRFLPLETFFHRFARLYASLAGERRKKRGSIYLIFKMRCLCNFVKKSRSLSSSLEISSRRGRRGGEISLYTV